MTKFHPPAFRRLAIVPDNASLPPSPLDLFGRPALAPGETLEHWRALADRLVLEIAPESTFECIMLRDVVDLSWDIARLRRARADMIGAYRSEGALSLAEQLNPDWGSDVTSEEVVCEWARGDEEGSRALEEQFERAGFGHAEIDAAALRHVFDDYERMDCMIAAAELRRDAAIDKIEARRAALAARARQAILSIEAGEPPENAPSS